jgi:hypothetical protein
MQNQQGQFSTVFVLQLEYDLERTYTFQYLKETSSEDTFLLGGGGGSGALT